MITSAIGTAGLTVSTAPDDAEEKLAEIVVVPAAMLMALPVAFTEAIPGVDELQVADCVMSWVDPSL